MAQTVKRLPAMRETHAQSLDWKIFCRRKWQPTPVLMPGKFHGWRSLVGYNPLGRKESDTTEQLHFQFTRYKSMPSAFILCFPQMLYQKLRKVKAGMTEQTDIEKLFPKSEKMKKIK